MPYSGGPVNPPSATPASTNNVNYMDDGTTGGHQGITPILFFIVILVLLNCCYIII
jgi:hypothetical protein